jgi:hypothetical protein
MIERDVRSGFQRQLEVYAAHAVVGVAPPAVVDAPDIADADDLHVALCQADDAGDAAFIDGNFEGAWLVQAS